MLISGKWRCPSVWPVYAKVWEALGTFESALTRVLGNLAMDTVLVTKSSMFLALLSVFQQLVYLYQQKEPICWCWVGDVLFRRRMSVWPQWLCHPAGTFNCGQPAGQHEAAEHWTSVDEHDWSESCLQNLPQRVCKRSYCRNDLWMGLGIAQTKPTKPTQSQVLSPSQKAGELFQAGRSYQAVGSPWSIWKSIIKNK